MKEKMRQDAIEASKEDYKNEMERLKNGKQAKIDRAKAEKARIEREEREAIEARIAAAKAEEERIEREGGRKEGKLEEGRKKKKPSLVRGAEGAQLLLLLCWKKEGRSGN